MAAYPSPEDFPCPFCFSRPGTVLIYTSDSGPDHPLRIGPNFSVLNIVKALNLELGGKET